MAGIVIGVLLMVGGVGYLAAGAITIADTNRIAKGQRHERMTDRQQQTLQRLTDPCDPKRAKAWVIKDADGDCDKVLARAQHYFERCDPYLRLRWATQGCYKALGKYDRAIAEVNRLIGRWPFDKDFRWWRGELYALKKDWDRALTDYWQAIILSPALRRIPYDIVVQAGSAKRPCRAVFPMLQHAYYHQGWKLSFDDVNTRLAAMKACPDTLGKGTATGPVAAGHEAPPLPVRINGKATGDFAMDLETGLTMISRAFADKLGLPRGKPFLAWYGEQLQSGHFVILKEVTWGGASARDVEALILRSPPFFTDGVLGRTFLLRFTGRYGDAERTQLTLVPRVFGAPIPPVDPSDHNSDPAGE